ncbi:uncharacterized protein B0P05DRAFT_540551 [Gilbertella persicaria]|uniref:uncharacterized protein n=1 Tax=Gilbertella persicaria TaxID=101096 RepID=UPI00221F13BC|nr:uncharacterized protein B0P05DRAFT_540551 [Gilbertella persicaria]KAI8080250.1 hypothetical protein B0P05DRAFT_540551 [Gilbertella persicaria]
MYSNWFISLLCLFIVFLSCLSIGFGSWFETNNLISSSSATISELFSFLKLSLHSSEANHAIQLTFGLWKYCIIDHINHTHVCSPTRMNFHIDTKSIIHYLNNNHLNNVPALSATSYVRVISLLFATLGAVLSIARKKKRDLQRKAILKFISLQSLISATLTATALGVTLRDYTTDIQSACMGLENGYICSSYTPSFEIILIGISIGLFVVCTAFGIICSQLSPPPVIDTYAHYSENQSIHDTSSIQVINENVPDSDSHDMEKLELDYSSPSSSSNQRASLRPPPQRQRSVRTNDKRTSVVENKVYSDADETHHDAVPNDFYSSFGQENILSYLWAFQGNYVAADDSSQSSYNHRTDSIGSQLYAVGALEAQSNHTLGGSMCLNNTKRNSSSIGYYNTNNNSSFSGDEEDITTQAGTSNNIPTPLTSDYLTQNDTLYKRIDDYLRLKDKQ